jgi:phosphatidylserine/phosphatidylglycerophosphate/cardiolipin synthase-like enzyme
MVTRVLLAPVLALALDGRVSPRDLERMEQLRVTFGCAARDALCAAFDAAHSSIDTGFYSLSDPDIIASLNAAAMRNVAVEVHIEGNPSRFGRKPDTGERAGSGRSSPAIESLRHKFVNSVHLVIENDPDVLMHGKAAVID